MMHPVFKAPLRQQQRLLAPLVQQKAFIPPFSQQCGKVISGAPLLQAGGGGGGGGVGGVGPTVPGGGGPLVGAK